MLTGVDMADPVQWTIADEPGDQGNKSHHRQNRAHGSGDEKAGTDQGNACGDSYDAVQFTHIVCHDEFPSISSGFGEACRLLITE